MSASLLLLPAATAETVVALGFAAETVVALGFAAETVVALGFAAETVVALGFAAETVVALGFAAEHDIIYKAPCNDFQKPVLKRSLGSYIAVYYQ